MLLGWLMFYSTFSKQTLAISSTLWNKKAVLSQRSPRNVRRYISGSNEPLRRYGHSKLSNMAACRHLRFDVTRNSAIRSADPENPILEPNMKCIESPVPEIWPFAYLGGFGIPILAGKGGRRGSSMAPLERAMVFYRLSIVTVAVSVTIRPHRMSPTLKSTGRLSLWAKISGCSPWSRPVMFESAECEYPRLTRREIIFEEFQPMWSQSTSVTDGQTDDMRSQDRAVKSYNNPVRQPWNLETFFFSLWC